MMFKFIVALPCEANPLIEYFKLKQTHTSPFAVYQNEEVALAVSGVGGLNASGCVMHLNQLLPKEGHWINLGVAGHLSHQLGDLFLISKVSHPQIKKSYYPYASVEQNLNRFPLTSLDAPSQNYLSETLYDMEGYGFTFSCCKIATLDQIHLFKVISDNSDTPLFSVQKKEISKSIENHLPQIEAHLNLLRGLKRLPAIEIEIPTSYPVHFSQTQKHQLIRILKILELHRPGQYSFNSLKRFTSSRDLLLYLEKELFELSLTDL